MFLKALLIVKYVILLDVIFLTAKKNLGDYKVPLPSGEHDSDFLMMLFF